MCRSGLVRLTEPCCLIVTCPSGAHSVVLHCGVPGHYYRTMAAQVSESDQIKQFKEFLGTYNKLTENCFMDCVKDFTTREVKTEETSCSESCLQKYLKMTQRISMRFQEYHIQQNEALAAKAGLLGQPR
ncbi:mitochondrial import inner membrane translocase subunit Tim9 isoform X1 [Brachyhypopomus gauderio]|uniref:mitochondrial import inner membrane translocase subunit Tim9 isoform X1 n=2 Tax=Brachyhypopomus gauderio TaxID=698409 RepID=UPI004042FEAB